jgi:phage terminase Nu1 subunit (DNA packaging protein)
VKKHEKLQAGTKFSSTAPAAPPPGRPGRKPSPTSLHAARTRKEMALAELRELEVRQKRGSVLDAEVVARRWEVLGREVQARVLACTSRIRAALPHLTTHDAEVIDRELRAALTGLADAS